VKTKMIVQDWADALLRHGVAPELVESAVHQGIACPRHFVALTETDTRSLSLSRRLSVDQDRIAEIRRVTLDAFPTAATPSALHFGDRVASGLMPKSRQNVGGPETVRAQLLNHFREFAPLDPSNDEESIDHRDKCDPVGDQLGVGACWVWGTLTMVSVVLWLATGRAFRRLSPKFLFQDIKANHKDPYPDSDGGRPEYACDALLDVGCCTEETYPYEEPIDRDTIPPAGCYTESDELDLPLLESMELPTDNGIDPNLLCGVLMGTSAFGGRALTGGLPLYPSFFETDESGLVMDPSPEEREWGPAGYHLMAMVGTFMLEVDCGDGRTVRIRYYTFRNSWGTGFGDTGDIYVSENYVHDMLMCCLAMFHRNEVESWERNTLSEPAMALAGARCREEARSGLAQGLLLTIVLCLVAAALLLLSPALLAARPLPPTPAELSCTGKVPPSATGCVTADGSPDRQGKTTLALVPRSGGPPTWDQLRHRLNQALRER
jgi:hypothetical protein